mmetsp:Transcript_11707/g.38575  ORF Transcript_11707/g.38575 Transcript_11707/m.38575 type:complete len:225 (-) Transcript_11707:645-1319(-)
MSLSSNTTRTRCSMNSWSRSDLHCSTAITRRWGTSSPCTAVTSSRLPCSTTTTSPGSRGAQACLAACSSSWLLTQSARPSTRGNPRPAGTRWRPYCTRRAGCAPAMSGALCVCRVQRRGPKACWTGPSCTGRLRLAAAASPSWLPSWPRCHRRLSNRPSGSALLATTRSSAIWASQPHQKSRRHRRRASWTKPRCGALMCHHSSWRLSSCPPRHLTSERPCRAR